MIVHPQDPGRSQRPGLLWRPPSTFRELDVPWTSMMVDPAQQIDALAQLMNRGLLSREEFDRAKQRALRWSTDG